MKKTNFIYVSCLFVLFLGFFSSSSSAEAVKPPFSLSMEYALEGEEGNRALVAAIRIAPESGYYAYAHTDTGAMPTTLTPEQGDAMVLYPKGAYRPDLFEPGKQVLAYEGPFSLFVHMPYSAGEKSEADQMPAPRSLRLSMLLCSAHNCVPVQETLAVTPPTELPPLKEVSWAAAYRKVAADSPSEKMTSEAKAENAFAMRSGGTAAKSSGASPASESVFGDSSAVGTRPVPEKAASEHQSQSGLSPFKSKETAWRFMPRYPQQALEPAALGSALFFGLLAGLLLNVMPCVLPVLTMKVSGLLTTSGEADESKRLARFREHNLLFAAGIMTWFVVLALAVGGLGIAWGGLFQNTAVVYGLLVLVFLLALSLFDVFTLPVLDFKIANSNNPRLQAYLTGVVATLLATPCSGPLLGGVLGWAALQPLAIVLVVFAATGLGMALPYLFLAFWPGAARLLPKPGPWTGVMERLVGFFLLGTALYLFSILPESRWLRVLVSLLAAALAAWIWGQWGGIRSSGWKKVSAGLVAGGLIAGSIWWGAQTSFAAPSPWRPFDAASFQAVLGKEPILLEFTADWCPSCKVLERTTLTPRRLRALAEQYQLTLFKVDLTRPHPEAQALLRSLGSVSIPLTAVFPKGFLARSPLVLRDLYTPGQLEDALRQLDPGK